MGGRGKVLVALLSISLCLLQGVFEQRFAKMPDEHVEVTSQAGGSLEKPESAEERATRLAELQEQVGAHQVGYCTDVLLLGALKKLCNALQNKAHI